MNRCIYKEAQRLWGPQATFVREPAPAVTSATLDS
jgi:hypothetical protein